MGKRLEPGRSVGELNVRCNNHESLESMALLRDVWHNLVVMSLRLFCAADTVKGQSSRRVPTRDPVVRTMHHNIAVNDG